MAKSTNVTFYHLVRTYLIVLHFDYLIISTDTNHIQVGFSQECSNELCQNEVNPTNIQPVLYYHLKINNFNIRHVAMCVIKKLLKFPT